MPKTPSKQVPLQEGATYRCHNKVVKLLKVDGPYALLYEYSTGMSFTAKNTELDYVTKVQQILEDGS